MKALSVHKCFLIFLIWSPGALQGGIYTNVCFIKYLFILFFSPVLKLFKSIAIQIILYQICIHLTKQQILKKKPANLIEI